MNQVSDIVAETGALIDGWRARAMGIVVGALITFVPPWIGAEETGKPARELKRVLILESFGRDFAVWNAVPPAFKEELARQLPWPIEFHEAALETARADQPQAETAFVEYLRALYAQRPPDLVVPVGAPAAQFLCRHRAGLFSQTPVLIGGIDQRLLPTLSLGSNDTAVVARTRFGSVHRDHVAVVPGNDQPRDGDGQLAPRKTSGWPSARQAFQPYTNRLQVHLAQRIVLPGNVPARGQLAARARPSVTGRC